MPGVMMPEGMASEWVSETALPSASTTLRWGGEGVAVGVRRAQVGGGARHGRAGVHARHVEAMARADLLGHVAGHVLGQQLIERHIEELRVADVLVLVDGRLLH